MKKNTQNKTCYHFPTHPETFVGILNAFADNRTAQIEVLCKDTFKAHVYCQFK